MSRARDELLDLARFIEQNFALAARPKFHHATEADVIYQRVLARIAALNEVEVWTAPREPDLVEVRPRVDVTQFGSTTVLDAVATTGGKVSLRSQTVKQNRRRTK